MRPTDILQVIGWEDTSATVMGRFRIDDGTYLVQADLSSISGTVFDLNNGNVITGTFSVTISSSVFDTLQTDSRWTVDTTGYNFLYTISGSYFPTGGHKYRAEIIFHLSSGLSFPFVVHITAQDLFTS